MRGIRGAVALCLLGVSTYLVSQTKPESVAQSSSDSWLALVDSGKYAESWQEAATTFRAAVATEQWQKMVASVRDPLGKVASRKLKSATYTKTMPGAPDGDYVVILYDTSFEHKQSAVETVATTLDKGKWRVSGYFIR